MAPAPCRGRKLPISSGMVADRIVTRAIAATFLRYKVPAGRTASSRQGQQHPQGRPPRLPVLRVE